MRLARLALFLVLTSPFCAFGQVYEGVASWRYVPVDAIFWDKAEGLRQKKDFIGLLSLSEEKAKNTKAELEQAEAQYAMAVACLGLEYTFCAYEFSMALIKKNPGSMPATAALFVLEELVQQEAVVDDDIQRVLNVGNFTEVPEALLPMVLYYVFKDNRRKNLKEWQQENYRRIPEKTYWRTKLNFYKILNLVKVGKPSQAEKDLQALEKVSERYPKFRERIRLQRARLFYQMGQYKEADAIYLGFLSQSREFGKILLERAWVKYFQKDYSVALGMIESLKSSYFRGATHPEQYILAMVTYRDLCHYEAVIEVHKEFQEVYKPWIEHLKEQKPFFENRALLTMVLLQAQNIPLGNMIGRIRLEAEKMKLAKFSETLKKKFEDLYTAGEGRWKDFASQFLNNDLKAASVDFLDFVEQAKLLDYISGLDQHRVKGRFENREYKAPQAEKYAIQKLFWPVSGEYWWSEVNSYRVLASDRCTAGGAR